MSTVNKEEIQKFSKLADEWWDVNGKFKPLHVFIPIRIEYIKEKCVFYFFLNNLKDKPLSSIKVLDIGCGGGLVSEPMYRLGAEVTGLDASLKNINVAKLHAKKNNLKIRYLNSSPEKKNLNEKFDVILCLEIVEHIQNLDIFLKASSELLKKNGIIFIATINRTFQSYLKAIVGAEYILKWLPIGTHEWNKFLKPGEIENQLTSLNFNKLSLDGFQYNILTKEWTKSQDCSVNYIITCKKN
jgi:2-polyprenyl-6-hydroxyphenyl methylase/3-demethylubiquinone-9 3-methyltransferase